MLYLTRLSKKQYVWLIGTLCVAIGIVVLGWAWEPRGETLDPSAFATESSIKDIAPPLGVTGKALARELDLPLDVPKKKPLRQLGIEQDKLDHVVAHIASHRPTLVKYYVFGETRESRPGASHASPYVLVQWMVGNRTTGALSRLNFGISRWPLAHGSCDRNRGLAPGG